MTFIYIKAVKKDEVGAAVIQASVSAPVKAENHQEWTCAVSCPEIFKSKKTIAGVDAQQAQDLAKRFIITVLQDSGYHILD